MTTGHWDFGGERELTDEQRATLHERVHAGPEFRALRRRMRRFTFPLAAAFLLWYVAFVLMASYARGLMATPVVGAVNLGLVVGLAQFATTFALTAGYVRYARRHLDPLAEHIRTEVEAEVGGAARPTAASPRTVAVHPPRVPAADGTPVGSAR